MLTMICDGCTKLIAANIKFCGTCGKHVEIIGICPKCQTTRESELKRDENIPVQISFSSIYPNLGLNNEPEILTNMNKFCENCGYNF